MIQQLERPERTSTDLSALAAVAVTVFAWASAFVAIRWVGRAYEPGPLALGRLLVGGVALGGFLLVRRTWVRPHPREWRLLAVVGIGWFGIYNVALNAGERHVDAGTASLVVNVGPILIAVFAGVLLREGFPRWLLIGAAVAFGGTALIGLATRTGEANLLGVLLCLTAAVTYAIGVLSQKPLLRRLPGLQVTWLACAIGTLCCLPFLPQLVAQVGDASARQTLGLAYLGLVPTALAFSTWAYALARMDAGRLGVTTYLAPPIAILLGWLLLDEVPELLALIGGFICLVGVSLSRRRDPQPDGEG